MTLSGGAAKAWGALDAVLGAYAQVLFARSRITGALLLAATALEPRALGLGLVALAVAAGATALLGVGDRGLATSAYGYNALLVGLSVGHRFGAAPTAVVLASGAAVVTVLVTAALLAAAERAGGGPVLSLPFVIVCWLTLGIAPTLGLAALPAPVPAGVLEALGSLFFVPKVDAGILVLAALVWHSRIASLLALMSAAAVACLGMACPALADGSLGAGSAGIVLNAMLTAVAIGGVWFVPSPSSFVLGLTGALAAVGLAVGLGSVFGRVGLPLLILPFNASVWLVLHATRRRVFDARPKSVDFVPGSPEDNLAYYRTRLARFQAPYAIAFRLPFRGAWVCTQGVDGSTTHQGAWRHAFDFEVRGDDGRLFRGQGAALDDHHCHKLPVLAAAEGVVVKVVSDVPDNAVGEMNLERNWGNCVVVRHAPGLCSLVAHLARGSVRVVEGQPVRRGDVLGACGSSGRSPRPHLHFQLQSTPALGAPTLPCRFSDAVLRATDERLLLAAAPGEGDVTRNLEPDEALAALLAIEPGATLVYRSRGAIEHLDHEVDLLGNLVLRSRETGAVLCFARTEDGFTSFDPLGAGGSVVHLLRAALSRVPFDAASSLVWSDYLPSRWAGGRGLRAVRQLASPFLSSSGVEMRYRLRAHPGGVDVVGESLRLLRGEPEVHTLAELRREIGVARLEVHACGRVFIAEHVKRGELPATSAAPVDLASAWTRGRLAGAQPSTGAGGSP